MKVVMKEELAAHEELEEGEVTQTVSDDSRRGNRRGNHTRLPWL